MARLCLLILSAVLGLALTARVPSRNYGKSHPITPFGVPWVGEPRDQGWVDRHNGFVQNTNTNGQNINVLFYGDSITDAWDDEGRVTFEEFYVPLGTANYGIGGDRTEHVLWRIVNGEVAGLNSKLCVLKIGTNNMGDNSDEDIARGVAAITDTLRSKLPNMKILLLGVLPRSDAQATIRTENINRMISVLDNGNTIRFLNMIDTFYRGDGVFNTELYNGDLLHLSPAGYVAWAATMNPLFIEMLN